MDKLEQLEKSLKEYKELLKNADLGYSEANGSLTGDTNAGGVAKGDDEKEKKEDKKEDEKQIEEKLDEHNEKKHGEDKDKDSAFKSETELVKFDTNGQWSLEKGVGGKVQRGFERAKMGHDKDAAQATRQPAIVTNISSDGKSTTKELSADQQVSAQKASKKGKADSSKAAAEAAAAERRAKLKASGELK